MNNYFDNTNRAQIWIELIGFDNTLEDFGIDKYLETCAFKPHCISLLLSGLGVVFNDELSACEASYEGHEYNPERRRQEWTWDQAEKLIDIFHSRSVKVYLSYFNFDSYTDENGKKIFVDFFKDKQYLHEIGRSGDRGTINVLKRLDDGRYFEDILIQKTLDILIKHNFDGIQVADGISSARLSLQEGDFSEDMILQFRDYISQISNYKSSLENFTSDYIWSQLRKEWIEFHKFRWNIYYKKFVGKVKGANKDFIFNSAWTRDPFEAIYRYGIDYNYMDELGVDGCMVEDVSATLPILSELDNIYLMTPEQRIRLQYDFRASLALCRAAMPKSHITPLSAIHDTNEQWGVLQHLPTQMTRQTVCNLNTFIVEKCGLKPIVDGPHFCLSDCLSAQDWNFIRGNWNLGYTSDAEDVEGLTFIYSENRLYSELREFMDNRRTPSHRLYGDLLFASCPIHKISRLENLEYIKGDIIVTNPDLLTKEELNIVKKYHKKAYYIGAVDMGNVIVCEKNGFENTFFGLLNSSITQTAKIIENLAEYTFDPKYSLEAINCIWTHELCFSPLSKNFFEACSDEITSDCSSQLISTPKSCKMIAVKRKNGNMRIIISNEDYYYNHATVKFKIPIKSVTCLTKYKGYKVTNTKYTFTCRIPLCGAEIFDVEF